MFARSMLDVRGDFSMRKNKKRFVGQTLNDRIGDLFGRQSSITQQVGRRRLAVVQHARMNALRAEARHAKALAVVGD